MHYPAYLRFVQQTVAADPRIRILHAHNEAMQLFALEGAKKAGLPVRIAKTQASLSDDPALLGAPEGFTVTVRSVTVSAGAGFLVALTGDVLTMPGLPKVPAAENIDVDDDGRITGLF